MEFSELKPLLEVAALGLGLVNGLMLLQLYTRDRPKLVVTAVHPDVYQWWFRFPSGQSSTLGETRRFGILVYVGISNKGLRKVAFHQWRLRIRLRNFRTVELTPITIEEPKFTGKEFHKVLRVLGTRGPNFSDDNSLVESGDSTAGVAYFCYGCYGNQVFDPQINNGIMKAQFVITDVFGNKSKATLSLREKSLDSIKELVPSIETVSLFVEGTVS